ncbi:MAG: hypothetical protein GXP62_03815 [Oligoflexia bacterium]|nr:hypothetical protein [Oligoflexia bacterium]
MTSRPTHETVAGSRYLALRKLGRELGRPTAELLQIYALEGFLALRTDSEEAAVRELVAEVASVEIDDGLVFRLDAITSAVIRDENIYPGVRVRLKAMVVAEKLVTALQRGRANTRWRDGGFCLLVGQTG